MTLFRTVDGVIAWFDNAGAPINPDGSPRGGPTLDALGGADGTEPPGFENPGATPVVETTPPRVPVITGGGAPSAGSAAQLNVQVSDATTGAPIAGARVNTDQDYGSGIEHVTDTSGVTSFSVPVGVTVLVGAAADGYTRQSGSVQIFDASDHWFGVALRPGSQIPKVRPVPVVIPPPSTAPPGIPTEIVLHPGQIGELTPVASTLTGDVAVDGYARAAVELRAGVPSLTAQSFSALDVVGSGASPSSLFASIIGGLIGLFKGSSGNADVNRLSFLVQSMGQFVLQLASTVADVATRSVHSETQGGNIFSHLLSNVLGPIINALAAVVRGGSSDLGKLFGPISDSIKKLVSAVRHIYDAWLKPILKVIDTTRQILRVLEAFHLKWAAEADAALGRLEGKLSAPLLLAIRKLNEVSNVVNRIVTLDGALQRVTLLRSMVKHAPCVNNVWWNSQASKPGQYAKQSLDPVPPTPTPDERVAAIAAAVDNDDGPHARQSDRILALIGELMA